MSMFVIFYFRFSSRARFNSTTSPFVHVDTITHTLKDNYVNDTGSMKHLSEVWHAVRTMNFTLSLTASLSADNIIWYALQRL